MSSTTARLTTSYRPRLRGENRARVARELAEGYDAGSSIRALASGADLSYGTARTLLLEAQVKLRGRGGSR
ncbi:helix-turn-helix domain-containing protein [Streptomyces sp. NPDC006307]|uniref:helix-turn-helix domain-containing protein n=1 Tax=Streptomyces sp. NPDC006307 TaxID=3156748 RepID=UPI0033AD9E49